MAIKSFTDTYIIKGSDVDRFCRIILDTKKIEIKKANEHHDIKNVRHHQQVWVDINQIV